MTLENVTFEGDLSIHLILHYLGLIGNKEVIPFNNSFELYFEYHDVKLVNERLKAAGVTFVHEIREQPWKQRVLRFYDPEGHIIEIGESIQFLSCFLSC
ncbi:MAG: VOC family protein [Bacteroidota bacterium]